MDTNSIAANPAQLNGLADPAATGVEKKSTAALTSDFETFLRMLTVQLQNQDPLNPVEASDYAVQLATFSGVEQQVKTNDLLASLGDKIALMGLSQFAGWVEMTARYTGPVGFSGTPVGFSARPDPTSDAAYLVVRDPSNNTIDRRPIHIQGGEMVWDGLAADGSPFPVGLYHFFVESARNGTVTGTEPAEVFDLVTEASVVDGETQIVLSGGQSIPVSAVSGLR